MKRNKRIISYSMIALLSLTLSGCGRPAVSSKAQINIPLYDRIKYNSAPVEQGDIEPEVTLKLQIDDYHTIAYTVDSDELEVDTLYVSERDRVKKGDVLVTFKAGDLKEEIEAYQNQLEEDELIIEHYKRLMKIDENASQDANTNIAEDGSDDVNEEGTAKEGAEGAGQEEQQEVVIPDLSIAILDIEREIELLKVQIEEATARMEGFRLVAQEDGTITQVEDCLKFGYAMSETAMIKESCGLDDYIAVTKQSENFEIGRIYEAEAGVAKYEMKLKAVQESEKEGEQELVFEPISDVSGLSPEEILTITVKLPVIKNALYVPAQAVFNVEDKYYVYVIDEEGFRTGVEVTVGETIGEIGSQVTVITSGLNVGEQVMVR